MYIFSEELLDEFLQTLEPLSSVVVLLNIKWIKRILVNYMHDLKKNDTLTT